MKKKGLLEPRAQSALLAEAVLTAIQGGYVLSTAQRNARPMQTALAAAYTQLRASRARTSPSVSSAQSATSR